VNWGQSDAAMAVQKAFLESYEQANRSWLARVQSEISLWSDLANKLSSTHSVPEAFEAYSKCVSQRMQMAAEDARQLVDESQQLMQKVTHSLGNKLPSAST
ncbi:MAG: phasin family protein, partial [Pseudolabrys sp.]